MHAIGLSAAAPGGYAEQVVGEESLMLTLPAYRPGSRSSPSR
jgi:hypothetical protein